jgi:hypothetical protein
MTHCCSKMFFMDERGSSLLWSTIQEDNFARLRSCLTGHCSIWIYTDAEEGLTR